VKSASNLFYTLKSSRAEGTERKEKGCLHLTEGNLNHEL
jgi:hypothetical protein